ncbi:multidrug resistance efflux transporter family protein [Paenibacillus mucilaginosus]|nr:multidrug resistance efflux transporter family protein [Paenibacillus mucilaginosus]MCG7212594.1 multidrug resistance efflux transporter family protein [Paenibacillus mucilaginosus]WDM25379.1 multidrug resistance efflux transporter family protein [Paenibacillus mucilaginosus]
MRPILLGILAAFFFAFTFVLNRSISLSGGSWMWSASLRYFFMVPLLLLLVGRHHLKPLWAEIRRAPGAWLLWSTVGFGLFYAPLCFASDYSPGWLIAGTWQITILSGSLLAPLFKQEKDGVPVRGRIPWGGLGFSLIILAGIVLIQAEHFSWEDPSALWLGFLPVLLASFAYPLGNRKMMDVCGGRLSAPQRLLGMTLLSLPFWLLLAAGGWVQSGLPSSGLVMQSALVAVLSGIIATALFFQATDAVRGDMQKLSAVEATQSLEVLFAVIGEVILLSAPLPALWGWLGMGLICLGMAAQSLWTVRAARRAKRLTPPLSG